jgi:hypothetical protein
MKPILVLAAALLASTLAACGGDTYIAPVSTVSKGTELTDLQQALSEGAITQSEYETLRARIMRRPN